MSDLSRALDWFGEHPETTNIISTVVDVISPNTQPRETISGTPTAGTPEGRDEINLNNVIQNGADVVTQGRNFYDQVKGLFGLGYTPPETQPVSPVTHEVEPAVLPVPTADGTPIKAGGLDMKVIAVIAVIAFMLFKK